MDSIERHVAVYRTPDGRVPFELWLDQLPDVRTRQKVQARIGRLRLGNLGDCRSVGEGVLELRINFGPGYRVYFGQDGPRIVVILSGGDKSSQNRDIVKAKMYWAAYRKEQHANN